MYILNCIYYPKYLVTTQILNGVYVPHQISGTSLRMFQAMIGVLFRLLNTTAAWEDDYTDE